MLTVLCSILLALYTLISSSKSHSLFVTYPSISPRIHYCKVINNKTLSSLISKLLKVNSTLSAKTSQTLSLVENLFLIFLLQFFFSFWQTDVPFFQSARLWVRQEGQIHPLDGHRRRRRLPVQVPQFPLDGRRQGRPRDAQTDVHTPGLTEHRRTMDAEMCLIP